VIDSLGSFTGFLDIFKIEIRILCCLVKFCHDFSVHHLRVVVGKNLNDMEVVEDLLADGRLPIILLVFYGITGDFYSVGRNIH
jgi:hypothetical protein